MKIKKNKVMSIVKVVMLSFLFIMISSTVLGASSDYTDIEISLINQDPNPVIAGDIVEIKIGIENVGTASVNDLVVRVLDEYPFEVISDDTEEIGSLLAKQEDGNMQILTFRFKVDSDVSAGQYELRFEEYSKLNSNVVTEHSIFIDVNTKESLEIESIDKSYLVPGQKETVSFKLKNVGTSVLKDVIFAWENEDSVILPLGADNSQYIKAIGVGEEVIISFDMIASSSTVADLYKLDLTISYQDSISSSITEVTTEAGMYIGGDTSFDLVYDEITGTIYSFTISNIGANNAESVTVKIPNQDGWKLNSGNSEIIGNLNKGDYTSVSFDLTKLTQIRELNLIIDYTNTMGERVSVQKIVEVTNTASFSVDGTTAKTGTGTGMKGMTSGVNSIVIYAKYAGYAILALIVLIIGYKVIKKKKK